MNTENSETATEKGDLYRLEVAVYWPGSRYPGDSGPQWEKRFETPQDAWSEALNTRDWFQDHGREVEMWLYRGDTLVARAERR